MPSSWGCDVNSWLAEIDNSSSIWQLSELAKWGHVWWQDGDAVVLFNFRADRMVEISKAFEYEEFNAFDRKRFPKVILPFPLPYKSPFSTTHAPHTHLILSSVRAGAACLVDCRSANRALSG